MRLAILTVRDDAAERYQGCYMAPTLTVGARMFTDVVLRGQDTMIRQHPKDFSLWCVGWFDDEAGSIESDLHLVISAEGVLRVNAQRDRDVSNEEMSDGVPQ